MATDYIAKIAQFFGVQTDQVAVLDHSGPDPEYLSANILARINGEDYDCVFVGEELTVFDGITGEPVLKAVA